MASRFRRESLRSGRFSDHGYTPIHELRHRTTLYVEWVRNAAAVDPPAILIHP
jgi:hypothetical protein